MEHILIAREGKQLFRGRKEKVKVHLLYRDTDFSCCHFSWLYLEHSKKVVEILRKRILNQQNYYDYGRNQTDTYTWSNDKDKYHNCRTQFCNFFRKLQEIIFSIMTNVYNSLFGERSHHLCLVWILYELWLWTLLYHRVSPSTNLNYPLDDFTDP